MKYSQVYSKRNIFLAIGTVLIAFILFYVYFLTKVFVRRTEPLPYIWPYELRATLYGYINTSPSRNVLVLSGPWKTGKTSAIINITNELRQNDTLVFNFNYKKAKSERDIDGFTKLAILEATKFYNNSQILKNINDIDLNNSYSVNRFFDFLENLTSTTVPVVFIQSVYNLRNFAPQIYEAGLSRLSRRDQYNDNVPVIIETSDSFFRMNHNLPNFFQIEEFDEIDDPYTNLGSNLRAFSSAELKKIKAATGFQGGPVDSIFEDIRKSETIEKAIDNELQKINRKVSKFVTNSTVFQKICDSRERQMSMNADEIRDIEKLIKRGFLYITDEYKVKVANHAVWKSICP